MNIAINGCSIHYEIIGTGRPVLCLHGFPEDHEVVLHCLEPTFSVLDGYQRIYLDLPGMGKSTSSETIQTADDMLAIVQAFIQRVIKNEPYLLVGQSYGGYLSLGLTMIDHEKIDGLFLLCPCVKADRQHRTLPEKQLRESPQFPVEETEAAAFSDFMEMAVIANEKTWASYKKDILPGLLRADEGFVTNYQANGYELSFESTFNTVDFDKPVTFLTGRQDDCVGYQDAFTLVPAFSRATFLVVDNAGHNLQIEQPVLFQETFKKWLTHVNESKEKGTEV
ncbi:alpha/beta hydrolase [uncultured Enterococcus sp.]|uniref:alpha/beta fold hydrolase n=1 Tax=uncultured Enterococcus sp. TaxID=167972 RepID=UPI002AA725F1|nr:alpha/beta hydrolase [uncultured Enterococcus sp.]